MLQSKKIKKLFKIVKLVMRNDLSYVTKISFKIGNRF